MMSRSRLPVLALLALCAVLLRGTFLPGKVRMQTFVALPQAMHRGCRSLSGGALAAGTVPAIVSSVPARRGVAAHYKVTLETPTGTQSFECPPDENILDMAEQNMLDLPFACRSGSCSSCAGKVLAGSIDQSGSIFLTEEQMRDGFCLTCTTFPTSDVTIQTGCEEAFLWTASSGSSASQTLDGNGE
ncbi:unnamed protein product [Polarella glacialis]|uniref:Ferredoxin n=1 Tax=Polarella glacialis TaxID=89957 RepID=A0A813JHM8_POLGL|nr:unnamed protein product [Polarella glacialis]|mmetsp:Transcript_40890/g.66058  ORF Transcript_40890/g.66058 Transcript_40890/m.66058 type:complete len:187 (-) Transcript_40890:109-669(-)